MYLQCSTCRVDKAPSEFYRDCTRATGHAPQCKRCSAEAARKRRQQMASRSEEEILAAVPPTKMCSKCRRVLPSEDFARTRSNADGLKRVCRGCSAELWQQWQQKQGKGS